MHARTLPALISLLILAGCGTSPKTSFYTLSKPAQAAYEQANTPTILIGPVTIPDLVDRPQLVLRTGDNQIQISDTHRWAQSLKSEITQAIAANIAQETGSPRVFLLGQTANTDADLRLSVHILGFESTLASHVAIEAQWTVRRKSTGKFVSHHRIVHEDAAGKSYDDLVAAHSKALARLSHEMATTLLP